ncbi:glycoside hydrolase family 95-like protein [Acidisarcina polymorpha]
MLLQSQAGGIELLPALPDAWPEGFIRGLCARG